MSPLMRTLETAAGVFGGGSTAAQPLMLRQDGRPREVSAHDAIGLPTNLPFVATEMCRERMGSHYTPITTTVVICPGKARSCAL